MSARSDLLRIEVVCAWPERVWLRRLELPAGSTVEQALSASGAEQALADETLSGRCGIFGQLVEGDHRLHDGDRLELYRPLLADPRDARRARVEADRPARSQRRTR